MTITHYTGRYWSIPFPNVAAAPIFVAGTTNREFTATGLIPRTNYIMEVEAARIKLALNPPIVRGPPATVTVMTGAATSVCIECEVQ